MFSATWDCRFDSSGEDDGWIVALAALDEAYCTWCRAPTIVVLDGRRRAGALHGAQRRRRFHGRRTGARWSRTGGPRCGRFGLWAAAALGTEGRVLSCRGRRARSSPRSVPSWGAAASSAGARAASYLRFQQRGYADEAQRARARTRHSQVSSAAARRVVKRPGRRAGRSPRARASSGRAENPRARCAGWARATRCSPWQAGDTSRARLRTGDHRAIGRFRA